MKITGQYTEGRAKESIVDVTYMLKIWEKGNPLDLFNITALNWRDKKIYVATRNKKQQHHLKKVASLKNIYTKRKYLFMKYLFKIEPEFLHTIDEIKALGNISYYNIKKIDLLNDSVCDAFINLKFKDDKNRNGNYRLRYLSQSEPYKLSSKHNFLFFPNSIKKIHNIY